MAHTMASGMGGIRTAGDLVAWMQLSKKMRIAEAKRYVAGKLGIPVPKLTDEDTMYALRKKLGIGTVTRKAGEPEGMEAKMRIAELLDIRINSVSNYRERMGKFFR